MIFTDSGPTLYCEQKSQENVQEIEPVSRQLENTYIQNQYFIHEK